MAIPRRLSDDLPASAAAFVVAEHRRSAFSAAGARGVDDALDDRDTVDLECGDAERTRLVARGPVRALVRLLPQGACGGAWVR